MTDSIIVRMQRLDLVLRLYRHALRNPRSFPMLARAAGGSTRRAELRSEMVLIHWELRELEKRFIDFSERQNLTT